MTNNEELLARAQARQNPEPMAALLARHASAQVSTAGYVNHSCRGAVSVRLTYLKGAADTAYLTGVLPVVQYEQVVWLASLGRETEAFKTLGRALDQYRDEKYGKQV